MPNYPPPDHCSGEPRESVLPTGLTISRVHSSEFAATSFNPRLAKSPFKGGRFDGTPDDPYPFLYAAEEDDAAVAEALLRDVPFDTQPRSLDYIFFEDRMGPEGSPFEEVVDPGGQLALGDNRLDQGLGQVYLEGIVQRYAITLGP